VAAIRFLGGEVRQFMSEADARAHGYRPAYERTVKSF
jgi:hypothetical protein